VLSQEGFAEVIGLSRTLIGAVEPGERNISIPGLCNVARALKNPYQIA
jgi:transcriptional regulator with XRE-family HTH domain